MGSWVKTPFNLGMVAIGSANQIWGVDASVNQVAGQIVGGQWVENPIPGGATQWIDVAEDGTAWALGRFNIFQWDGGGWDQVEGQLSQIAVGSKDLVWGVDDKRYVYQWTGSGWERVRGELLTYVDVGVDGTVWGLKGNKDKDNIYRYNGDQTWTHVSGTLKVISVANAGYVWGTDEKNKIYQYTGDDNGPWTRIDGTLSSVSAARDLSVWGVGPGGTYYYGIL